MYVKSFLYISNAFDISPDTSSKRTHFQTELIIGYEHN